MSHCGSRRAASKETFAFIRCLKLTPPGCPHQGKAVDPRHEPTLYQSYVVHQDLCLLLQIRAGQGENTFFLFSPIYRYVKRHTYFRCILICAKKQCGSFLAPICWLVWCSRSVTSRQSPRPCGDPDRRHKAVETRRESGQTSKPSKEAAVPLQSVIAASP